MKAFIFDIKHFAVHDGPGIRTTVFFKGCPLKCVWCHNPESISKEGQLGFLRHKCVGCGKCASVCPVGAHYIDKDMKHCFERDKCIQCGKCEGVCPAKALTLYGKEMECAEILEDIMLDKDFYESSDGGITLSGGECLLQADFCRELLKGIKDEGIHTAVDTCGFVSRSAIDKVLPYTDLFLYDIKAFSEITHKKCTGAGNERIIENLIYIDGQGAKTEIRIPFVPDYNDAEISEIAKLLTSLKNLTGVRVLPYHNYAATKYDSLDMTDTLPHRVPEDSEIEAAKATLASFGLKVLN